MSVNTYVNSCHQCLINKATNQRPAGLLQPLPMLCEPWESVSKDSITQLPVTNEGHYSIFVVVDRLTKAIHLIPTHTTVTACGVQHSSKITWVHHGYPKNFVTDRDSKFTSIFWEKLQKCCGIKHHKSSAYHLQTDGQTERMNRVLEDMLRNYVSPQQDDWDTHLASAEFAINNSFQESIKNTPLITAGILRHLSPGDYMYLLKFQLWKSIKTLQESLREAKSSLEAAQQRQKHYADKKRREADFCIGDEVLLNS